MSLNEKLELERKILAADLDHTIKVRLFQIIEGGASETEQYLIKSILATEERHKKPNVAVDTAVREEFHQP